MFSGYRGSITKPPPGTLIDPFHPLSQGLLGYWLFNEGTGSRANDISGHGNHGTLKNMSPNAQNSGWGGSKFGGGLKFGGVDDYVDCGDNSSLQITGAITLAGWVKLSDQSSGLFGRGRAVSSNGNHGYFLTWWNNGTFYFDTYSTTTRDALSTNASFTDSNWHFVVATWDGTTNTNGKKIYVDGVLEAQKTSTISEIGIPVGYRFKIGLDQTSYYTKGSIDSVRIYNRALLVEEVNTLYHDPFCNLLRVPVRYVSAAPSLPIPVAMNYYRRRRVA